MIEERKTTVEERTERHGNDSTGEVGQLATFAGNIRVDGNWVMFTVNGIKVEAKIFALPSHYGMNDGRISKLHLYNSRGDLFCYDRGPEINDAPPKGHVKTIVDNIVKAIDG